jgi:NhaP-type Na+/H+ or K+/H+ antiporter
MMFYFLESQLDHSGETGGGVVGFLGGVGATVAISVVAGYSLILIFQQLRSQAKLFLLISVLLLLYALGKKMHLSSLIIILIFGLIIANMDLFFRGKLSKFLKPGKAQGIYEGLHIVTMETAFVVRTFFFVIFGLTITVASLFSLEVALVSSLIVVSIYVIRFVMLRIVIGKDIFPQVFIAPRGLITILLFVAIPADLQVPGFDKGILLFIIISTSIIMTIAMVIEKRMSGAAVKSAQQKAIGSAPWKAKVEEKEGH